MVIRFVREELKQEMVTRQRLRKIFYFFAFCFLVLIYRSISLHLKNSGPLEEMAMRQYRAAVHLSTQRTRILDRKGDELAVSVPVWSIYADPKEIDRVFRVAPPLAKTLSLSEKMLRKELKSPRRFVWIKRWLRNEELEKVKDLRLPGIHWMREHQRYYPNGKLAANILGAVGVESQALAGIELEYDRYLFLNSGKGDYRRDARGHLYLSPVGFEEETEKGDVWLTIDKNIQFLMEEEIAKTVEKTKAEGGVGIVLNPHTGEIIAMASSPGFDPNRFQQFDFSHWRNRAVTDVYELGSIFKAMTLSAALEQGRINLEEKIYCENGNYALGSRIIHDSHPYEWLTPPDIIKMSSNIGVAKIAERLSNHEFYQFLRNMGFGEKTNIDFPGESSGLVIPSKRWRSLEKATIGFGQGIGVTPIQMAIAYGAIANGGKKIQPYLVEKISDREGEILYQAPKKVGVPVLKPGTAEIMKTMLGRVTQPGGTGVLAASKEYSIAGKTGTAQKVNPNTKNYYEDRFVASFVGFAPLEDPQLVALILIDDPKGGVHTGGDVAAPAFQTVMVASLHRFGVQPLNDSSLDSVSIPSSNKEVSESDLSSDITVQQEGAHYRIPDFRGASMRKILRATREIPVRLSFKGTGVAVGQSLLPGTLVKKGTHIVVEFAPSYGGEVSEIF